MKASSLVLGADEDGITPAAAAAPVLPPLDFGQHRQSGVQGRPATLEGDARGLAFGR
jgi:hypothetical protein